MAPMATGTRERILDASTELFRRQGYAGTGLKSVVDKAGAPFGSLYHHFPGGKDQLGAGVEDALSCPGCHGRHRMSPSH